MLLLVAVEHPLLVDTVRDSTEAFGSNELQTRALDAKKNMACFLTDQ